MNKKNIKQFILKEKFKFIILLVCFALGGANNQVSISGTIANILYIVSIALTINIYFDWKEFTKPSGE